MERKRELLDALEELKRRHPESKNWEREQDYYLLNQALVKLSLLIVDTGSYPS